MSVMQSKGASAGKKPQKSAVSKKKTARAAPKKTVEKNKKPAASEPVPKAQEKPKKAYIRHQPRSRFTPTQDQRNLVLLGKGAGMTNKQICALIRNPDTGKPISPTILQREFTEELETGEAQVLARVAGNLVSIASDRNHKHSATAAIFYLKSRAKWRDPEPEWAERKRLEASAKAQMGNEQISFTLVLEDERPPAPKQDGEADGKA